MKTRQLLKYGNSRILYYGENREECIFSAKKFFFPSEIFLPSIEIFPPDPALAVVSFLLKNRFICTYFFLCNACNDSKRAISTYTLQNTVVSLVQIT